MTLHVPPLFEYEPLPHRRRARLKETPQLGLLANFTWWPNRAALRWLAQQVLPRVSRDLRVHLFGEGSASVDVSDPRIVAHGFVNDVVEVFTTCDVMLCPIVSGAGVSIKFAEAIYNGVPVLATPFAARGLPLPTMSGVTLADGTDEWVRFLDGEGLEQLAAEEVPPKTSRIFALSTHAAAVHAFLRDTVAGANDASRGSPELRCAPSP